MAGVNRVTLVGYLGKDPQVRTLNNGNKVASFSLATSESWRDKSTGERREKTEWHNCVIFNDGLVKVAEDYLKKGSLIYLEGQLQTRKWTDQSGVEKYTTEIVLQQYRGVLTMLGGKDDNGGSSRGSDDDDRGGRGSGKAKEKQKPAAQEDISDEIPF